MAANLTTSLHHKDGATSSTRSPRAGTPTLSTEQCLREVQRCQLVLDNAPSSSRDAVHDALVGLRSLGTLPIEILSRSLIGKSVNNFAKVSKDELLRTSAKALVEEWKLLLRGRKRAAEGQGGVDKQEEVRRKTSRLDGLPTEKDSRTLAPSQQGEAGGSADDTPGRSPEEPTNCAGKTVLPGSSCEKPPTPRRPSNKQQQPQDRPSPEQQLILNGSPTEQKVAAEDGMKERRRARVQQKLCEALLNRCLLLPNADTFHDPAKLAADIERHLHAQLSDKDYASQARSLLFNVNDNKNETFALQLLSGAQDPAGVPTLTAEDMASTAKATERAQVRKEALDAVDADWESKHSGPSEGMIPCGRCQSTQTVYHQLQAGWGLDEPMTTFVTCLACKNHWKFDDIAASDNVDGV